MTATKQHAAEIKNTLYYSKKLYNKSQEVIMNISNNSKKTAKPMCLFCGQKVCLIDSSVGLKLVTKSIREGFNNYKLHISKPNVKGRDNASVEMAPYIIRHFIVQAYARESNLVGYNIVSNVPGCVLIKMRQNFPNKVGFYKDVRFNIKGNEQPPVEVLLIESEIALRCIRENAIEGRLNNDRYYQLPHNCTTTNVNNGRMEKRYGSLFVKTFNYLVGTTSSDTILHLTGIQESPVDEFGYVQHSFKKNSNSLAT